MNPALSKKELMNRSLSTITINIGKSGINQNVIDEIKRQLKAHEVIKLKITLLIAKTGKSY